MFTDFSVDHFGCPVDRFLAAVLLRLPHENAKNKGLRQQQLPSHATSIIHRLLRWLMLPVGPAGCLVIGLNCPCPRILLVVVLLNNHPCPVPAFSHTLSSCFAPFSSRFLIEPWRKNNLTSQSQMKTHIRITDENPLFIFPIYYITIHVLE